jgi:hypothetical protein
MPKSGVQSTPKGLFYLDNKIYFTATDSLKDNYGIAMTTLFTIDLCNAVTATELEIGASKAALKVYPNPVKGLLKMQTEATIDRIEIYSVTGNLVLQLADPGKQIDIRHLKNGVYLLKARAGDKLLTSKFHLLQ